jgi:hypothetical protein
MDNYLVVVLIFTTAQLLGVVAMIDPSVRRMRNGVNATKMNNNNINNNNNKKDPNSLSSKTADEQQMRDWGRNVSPAIAPKRKDGWGGLFSPAITPVI